MRSAVLIAAAALGLTGAAQQFDWGDDASVFGDPEMKRVCRSVKGAPFPAGDRPTAAQASALKGCDAVALYYGMGVPADPAKARQCAFAGLGGKDNDSFHSPHAVLMMIYANGKGAQRNLDLAIHLACTLEDAAPAEYDGRIEHLVAMKKAGARAETDFDLCDDVTSGYAMGFCASHQQDVRKIARAAEYSQITAAWTPAHRTAFAALERARDAYADARVENEVDVSGTGRAVFMVEAEEEVAEGFLKLLKRLEAGQGAAERPAALAAADRELNAVYRKVQGLPDLELGTVTKSGIRETQRVWLRYRDAWLAFARVKYPSLPQDALAAALTAERTKILKEFDI